MNFAKTVVALFGFAPAEVQSRVPPLFAYLGIFPLVYFASPIASKLLEVARALSMYVEWGLIALALFSVAMVVQGLIRVVAFRDTWSWMGWLRRVIGPQA